MKKKFDLSFGPLNQSHDSVPGLNELTYFIIYVCNWKIENCKDFSFLFFSFLFFEKKNCKDLVYLKTKNKKAERT